MSVLPQSQRVQAKRWIAFWLLCLASVGCYRWILFLSNDFSQDTNGADRPILLTLGLFGGAFVLYWLALWVVTGLPTGRLLAGVILGTSVLFRLVLLPSTPIQEIDIYRYVWDGATTHAEVSPYRYTPSEVIAAITSLRSGTAVRDEQLGRLAQRAIEQPPLEEILKTVHFAQLPTSYPPVSQRVFQAVVALTPSEASVESRLVILKTILVGFDVATLALVAALAWKIGTHVGWSLAYGWCPLVIKEFANSGHLDAIAVFYFVLAVSMVVWTLERRNSGNWKLALAGTVGSALALSLGIGAKIFPIVLIPLFVLTWWRWGSPLLAAVGTSVLSVSVALVMAPMVMAPASKPANAAVNDRTESLPPPPGGAEIDTEQQPSATVELEDGVGLKTEPTAGLWEFLKRWEMNDLLFLVLVENLRPQEQLDAGYRPWFAVVPDSWSTKLLDSWSRFVAGLVRTADKVGFIDVKQDSRIWELARLHENPFLAAGLLARVLMAGVLLVLACWWAWRASSPQSTYTIWLRSVFLTLVWCWLLSPTQNPWYLCWALPLLPWMRNRAWFALPAFTLLYYMRFWLTYHYAESTVLGTPYTGAYFFHFVVVWSEFVPWFLWLAIEGWSRKKIE